MSALWQYLIQAAPYEQICPTTDLQLDAHGTIHCGEVLNVKTLKQLAEHYIPEQIDQYFEIKNAIDEQRLRALLDDSRASHRTFSELYSASSHNHYLNLGCACIGSSAALDFRLTLFKRCLPYEFERTLFCLWLVIFESEEHRRTDEDFRFLFLTALTHDLGLLDVDPKITRYDHDPRSSKNDVDGYYRHTFYSARFAEKWLSVPDRVIKSIEQHHEVIDGTGYPSGKSGNQLHEYGQHVHLYDSLYSIYSKSYKLLGKTLADMKPVIEINAVTHFGQAAHRLLEILERGSRTEAVFFHHDEFVEIRTKVLWMAKYIEQCLEVIQNFTAEVGFRHEDKTLFALQNSFIHISLSYYKSRILHEQVALADAIAEDGEYKKLSKALEDGFFSLREIIFHINKFVYRLRLYCYSESSSDIRKRAEQVLDDLSRLTIKLIH